jgi:hypothetical protein
MSERSRVAGTLGANHGNIKAEHAWTGQLISSTEAGPAKGIPWPASGPVFPMSVAVSGMRSDGCCENCGHDGSWARMFPDSLASALVSSANSSKIGPGNTVSDCMLREEKALVAALSAAKGSDYLRAIGAAISGASSLIWKNSGTVSRGELSTHATSASPNGAVACSLSAVLETRPVPAKYWLSARAAAGILRRAERRGKTLPTPLQRALEALATGTATPGTPAT